MAKNNIRSFRYSDEVKEILEGFKGSSMNEKFENLVLHCFKQVPLVENQLQNLKSDIYEHIKKRNSFQSEMAEIRFMERELANMKFNLEIAARRARTIAGDEGKVCEELGACQANVE
jgi:cytoplasmic iron level regulating protein YaaA (DUF328/UPF0246 family)